MSLKSTFFFCILFNDLCQSHNNDNKKLNKLGHLAIYNDTFSFWYCYFLRKNNVTIFSDIFDINWNSNE